MKVSGSSLRNGWLIVLAWAIGAALVFWVGLTDAEVLIERRLGSVGLVAGGVVTVGLAVYMAAALVRISMRDRVLIDLTSDGVRVEMGPGSRSLSWADVTSIESDHGGKSLAIRGRDSTVLRPMLRPAGTDWTTVAADLERLRPKDTPPGAADLSS